MEIERKWLLKKLPTDYSLVRRKLIEQFYISFTPEIRLRREVSFLKRSKYSIEYIMTAKSEGTLSREEVETEISEEMYEHLRQSTDRPAITKDYYLFNCEGYPLEVSIVDGGRMIYAEVEFNSEEQAKAFILPIADAEEVTDNPAYKMKNQWNSKSLKE